MVAFTGKMMTVSNGREGVPYFVDKPVARLDLCRWGFTVSQPLNLTETGSVKAPKLVPHYPWRLSLQE